MSNARELAELGLEVDVDANGNVVVANDIISIGNADEKSIGFNFYGQSKYNFYMDGNTDGDKMFIRKGTTNVATFDTAGRMGLGIDGPESLLHLYEKGGTSGYVTLSSIFNGSEHNAGRIAWEHASGWNTSITLGTADNHSGSYRDELTIKQGKVGIGVSNPDRPVHIRSNDNAPLKIDAADSTQASIAYALNGNEKWYAGVDLSANGGEDFFIYDANAGANRLLIDNSGTVFVGKTTTDFNTAGFALRHQDVFQATRADNPSLEVNRIGSDGEVAGWYRQGARVGGVSVTSSGATYNTTSDRRLKTDIQPIANGTEKLMAMNPVTHKWKADPHTGETVTGFIAQEMQEIVPEAVSGDPDGEEMMSMDYGRITPVLVAALQDAHKKIEALEERLAELEAK